MSRPRWVARIEKGDAVRKAEAEGQVADSMDVREELIRKLHAGEMTLPEIQAELKRIKRNAKKNGQMTRSQVYSRS